MKKIILEQLREHSRVRGKEKTWISELTDDQRYELFLRLRNGESAKGIARFIQNGWGVNPEASVHSISQGILKFRKRIAHLLISPTTEGIVRCPDPFVEVLTNESTLESLEHIASLHIRRIQGVMEEEEKTGIRNPHLNRDLQALATLQKLINKQKALPILASFPRRSDFSFSTHFLDQWCSQPGLMRRTSSFCWPGPSTFWVYRTLPH
jgi:hypothetical protein